MDKANKEIEDRKNASVQKRLDAQAKAEEKRQEVRRQRELAKQIATSQNTASQNISDSLSINDKELNNNISKIEEDINNIQEITESESINNDTARLQGQSVYDEEKIKGKPQKYFLKHRPIFQESLLWLAKTYFKRSSSADALSIIKKLTEDSGTFTYVRREAYLTEADYYMHHEQYNLAISNLEKALILTKGKNAKARLNFILGQCYTKINQFALASEKFDEVIELKPSYEMFFNAQLESLRNKLYAQKLTKQELDAPLDKMLKDFKNEEFKDQIYFLKGEIAIHEGNLNKGIKFMQQGLAVSQKDEASKSKTYLKLAELSFSKDLFAMSSHYYDSTVIGLDKSNKSFEEITKIQENLKPIGKNLDIIFTNDSIITFSKKTKAEQEEFARKVLKERQKLKQLKQNEADNNQSLAGAKFNSNILNSVSQGGVNSGGSRKSNFFAYDQKLIQSGVQKFEKKWGSIPLVDNWRNSSLSKKENSKNENLEEEGIETYFISKSEIDEFLKDVPTDDASRNNLNKQLSDAFNALGKDYSTNINRDDMAINALEELIKRFPNDANEPEALYNLYFLYLKINQPKKAEDMANQLRDRFSGNKYSLYFIDKDLGNRNIAKAEQLNRHYESTFKSFQKGDFNSTFELCQSADSIFGNTNVLRPKFLLLTAMSLGHLNGKEVYVNSLNTLITQYPNTDEERKAKEFLRLLGSGVNEEERQLNEAEKIYKENIKEQHFVLVILKASVNNFEGPKIEISNFNSKYFEQSDLKIANILFQDREDRQIIVVRTFETKIKAMEYYNNARNKPLEFVSPSTPFDLYCISNSNYRELLKSKSLRNYDVWFKKYYRNL